MVYNIGHRTLKFERLAIAKRFRKKSVFSSYGYSVRYESGFGKSIHFHLHISIMNTLTFIIPLTFSLPILTLNPTTDIGSDWKFVPDELHGPAESDGITAFQELIVQASALPKEQGKALLFATGLADDQEVITGEDRLKVLAGRNHADPNLLWSLYKEDGQKTLRYLHDTYGVVWMEGLRRLLLNSHGSRSGFYLCRDGYDVGSWDWHYYWLDDDRDADDAALVLG
jgi:hypothetical protein